MLLLLLPTFPKLVLPPLTVQPLRGHVPANAVRGRRRSKLPELRDAHSLTVLHQTMVIKADSMWSMAVIGQREASAILKDDLQSDKCVSIPTAVLRDS